MKTKSQSKEPKFEESLERLEAIVQEMESESLPLDEILKKYEEGNKLIKCCASKLNEAEKRIEILMKEKDGSLGIKEFDLDKDADDAKSSSATTSPTDDEDAEEKDLF